MNTVLTSNTKDGFNKSMALVNLVESGLKKDFGIDWVGGGFLKDLRI